MPWARAAGTSATSWTSAPTTPTWSGTGQLIQVDPDEVAIGTVIVVQPGEKVPIDGVVVEGTSTLNTAALTGESLPRDVQPGEEIISGCINLTGLLKVRTTKEFGESTVSKILDLVENASSRKSRSEAFISRFARVYTPAVCGAALALAILPPLVRMGALGLAPLWGEWIYRALTFLVISCPCALVISIPLSFFAGIGGASKAGVLVKGSNYLEILSQTDYVVFDKTGTLTQGVFEVAASTTPPGRGAAAGVRRPGGERLLPPHQQEPPAGLWKGTGPQPGGGDPGDRRRRRPGPVDGHPVAAGNDKLMDRLGIPYIPCHSVGTVIHMAVDGQYAGHILIADVVKPTAKAAVQAAEGRRGRRRPSCSPATRDQVAEQVAADLGVDQVYSQLLPADKVEKVEELLAEKPPRKKLAFVGDGINDAPVLSRADIGIAMGAMGSDAAIEAADVVLMDDDPMQIAKAIRISRRSAWASSTRTSSSPSGSSWLCLVLGALGIANMWLAIFADVGVMILAVLNAIRALFVKNL